MLVLAACSPLHYSSEQVARTYSSELLEDSVSVRRMVDRLIQEKLQEQLDIRELQDGTIVREEFSPPDSAGNQHLVSRETTTFSKKKSTSAQKAKSFEEKEAVQVDSTQERKKASIIYIDEEKTVKGAKDGWLPWYIYVAALVVAVLLGAVLAIRGNRWFHIKTR